MTPQRIQRNRKKMKCYVLMISEKFPAKHKRAGEPTNFPAKMDCMSKVHTIRGNYELWRKRFDKIDKWEAYLSVRSWSGKPYKSSQVELFRFDKSDNIGIEKLRIYPTWVEDNTYIEIGILSQNDGLSFEDFSDWFKGYDGSKEMAIIHFTGFRYSHVF